MKRIVLVIAVLLVAAACSSDSDDTTTTTTAAGGGTQETSSTTTSEAPATTTTTQAAETTTTAAASASGDLSGCVVGVWELDSEEFLSAIAEGLEDEQDVGEFGFGGGSYSLTIAADGTFIDERADWTLAVTSDLGDLTIVINDRNEGTWSIDGDILSTTLESGDPPEIAILIDGEPFQLPGGASPIEPPDAEFTGATVACSGDTMSASFEGFTSNWTRTG